MLYFLLSKWLQSSRLDRGMNEVVLYEPKSGFIPLQNRIGLLQKGSIQGPRPAFGGGAISSGDTRVKSMQLYLQLAHGPPHDGMVQAPLLK